MTRGILIAGDESSLFAAAAAEAAKRVESFASACIPNRLQIAGGPPPKTELPAGAISLSWNPASPISARTMVLAAENRLGQINDAILVCSPPALFKGAEVPAPEEIEIFSNEHIKGWFFIIRELFQYFRRSYSGTLSFVIPEIIPHGKNVPVDLLGPAAIESFRGFARGILAMSANERFPAMGFTCPAACSETEFASWLFKTIDEGARKMTGRWKKYPKFKFLR